MLKSASIKMISVIIALTLFIFCGLQKSDEYDVKDPENCKLNFTVISDSHIEGNNFTRYRVYQNSLQNVRKNKSGNDAVVFLGDNTMNGQFLENALFHGTADLLLHGMNVLPALGNHDIGNGEGNYDRLQRRWYDFTDATFGRSLTHPYYYEVIDGYYFIVLGMEEQLVYEMTVTNEQFEWLEGVLKEAAGSGKPVFVFSHYPSDYVIDESGEYTDRLINMLARYNAEHDLFYFCGHTHMPLYLGWSFHNSDGFPETYLPRLTELGGENDKELMKNTGIGVEVEVYPDSVCIRGRDFFRGDWRYEDDEPCEVTYELKNPVE